ncbi:MAG: hypothetical protein WA213_01920 [Terriglobales bacterium]
MAYLIEEMNQLLSEFEVTAGDGDGNGNGHRPRGQKPVKKNAAQKKSSH